MLLQFMHVVSQSWYADVYLYQSYLFTILILTNSSLWLFMDDQASLEFQHVLPNYYMFPCRKWSWWHTDWQWRMLNNGLYGNRLLAVGQTHHIWHLILFSHFTCYVTTACSIASRFVNIRHLGWGISGDKIGSIFGAQSYFR